MTPKQEMFVKEYMVDLNATQAAIRAGYSSHTANRIATENLSKPVINAAIAEYKQKRAAKLEITAEKVIRDIEEIKALAIENKDYSVALRASELQGKHIGTFTDKQEISGPGGKPIETKHTFEIVKQ